MLSEIGLDGYELTLVALILFVGSLIQSSIGFGYGLFSASLMIAIGFPLHQAVLVLSTCASIQSMASSWSMRTHIPWSDLKLVVPLRWLGLAVGCWCLYSATKLDVNAVKPMVGYTLLFMLALQMMLRVEPREKLHPIWGFLSFTSSGFLAGLVGMGGPSLLIWLMAHDWSKEKIKAFLFASFSFFTPVQMVILAFMFGREALLWILISVLLTPVILLGTKLGLMLGQKISKKLFRVIVFIILVSIGVNLIYPSLM